MEIVEKSDNLPWKVVKKAEKPDSYQFVQSVMADNPFAIHYKFNTVAPPEMIHDLFLDGTKWYRWVSSSRVDPITKIFKVQIHL